MNNAGEDKWDVLEGYYSVGPSNELIPGAKYNEIFDLIGSNHELIFGTGPKLIEIYAEKENYLKK